LASEQLGDARECAVAATPHGGPRQGRPRPIHSPGDTQVPLAGILVQRATPIPGGVRVNVGV
jgi:hypothetical protein